MTVLAQVRRLSANELKSALNNDENKQVLTIDCRSFIAFNTNHIRGSHNIHFPRILRRRCKGSLPMKHILTCPETRDELIAGVFSLVVVYDEKSSDLSAAGQEGGGDMQPVLQTLLDEPISHLTTEVCFLEGGFQTFSRDFPTCCVSAEQPTMPSPNKIKTKRLPPTLTLTLPPRPLATNTLLNVSASPSPSPMQVCSPLSAGPNYERADPVQILPYLFLGSVCHASRKDILDAHGITAIVNVSTCCQNFFPSSFKYKHIAVNDDGEADLLSWFDEAAEFIDSVKLCGGKVLIHCYAGISRSATVCLAYLMKSRHMRLEEAFEFVRKVRAVISPNLGFMMQLSKFEAELRQKGHVTVTNQVPRRTRIAGQLSVVGSSESLTKKAKLSRELNITCENAAAVAAKLTRSVSLPVGNYHHVTHKKSQGICNHANSLRGHDATPQRFVFNFGMAPTLTSPSPFTNNWPMSPQNSPSPICSPS